MGLNACKSIAQHYNGNIEVESEKFNIENVFFVSKANI